MAKKKPSSIETPGSRKNIEEQRKISRAGLIPESDWTTHVRVALAELNIIVDAADKALDGNSNDAEHDALCGIREKLAGWTTDPERRI